MDYVHITTKRVELTDPMKAYIEKAIESLKKYNLDITGVQAVISAEEKNGKKGFLVEFVINMPRKETIVIKQKDKDIYAATDLAMDRAQKVLSRHHDKARDRKLKEDEAPESVMAMPLMEEEIKESLGFVDEIIPHNLDLDKPTEIAEAMEYLKRSQKYFIVFEDLDGKTRTMYKRKDGKFGLY